MSLRAPRFADTPAPGEREAGERSWAVVRAAFASREPTAPRSGRPARLVAVATALVALAAAVATAATPAGRDAVRELRRAVGVETATPGLFSLPAGGRVLVTAPDGAWVVAADGRGRRLGRYAEASWSPFGRYVVAVAAGRRELVALEPDGNARWSLARPGPLRLARWGGTERDTRVAYLSGPELRVVAGDGTDDRLLASRVRPVAPSWRPGAAHVLTYVDGGGAIVTVDVDTRREVWRRRATTVVRELEWAADGRLLLVRGTRSLSLLGPDGRLRFDLLRPPAAPVADAALAGRGVAYVQWADGGSSLWLVPRLAPDGSAARRIFEGAGRIDDVHPSPDGRWLLLSWPTADQWLFVRARGRPRVDGASGIRDRFGAPTALAGWCCRR